MHEIVDVKALKANARNKPRDDAEANKIAEIAHALMGNMNEIPFGELWNAIGVRMREERICEAKHRPTVTGRIISALAGEGVSLTTEGQSVLIQVKKKLPGDNAPWYLTRTVHASEAIQQ